jgi:hypothetical protein
MSKYIWVTFQRKGFHKYPSAPSDVVYLQSMHRHLFKFKVKIEVFHDDREIEFHQFMNKLESWYDSGALDLDYRSCEMMADELFYKIESEYRPIPAHQPQKRKLIIEISEDGECGAECHYEV